MIVAIVAPSDVPMGLQTSRASRSERPCRVLAREVLASRGVRCHVSATHVRALFALFGPWVPMTVYAPRDDAQRATELLLALFDTRRPPPNVEQAFT